MHKRPSITLSLWTLSIALAQPAVGLSLHTTGPADERPNVLVVMVDDLGFSDLGCYGSEIQTPNIDRLAVNGLRFSQFYNTAKCHSSRISLLTGCYAIQAGGSGLQRAVTSAEVLSSAGYFSMMTGKWHLKGEPTDFGFERYFGHLSGACNYFSGDDTFRLNGESWKVPEQDFYTTIADVDFALQFLDEARQKEGRPWYLYVAFNAPHAPLQPLEVDYKKYAGKYDKGWDVMREARLAKQRELQLFGEPVQASARPNHVLSWESLDEPRRTFEAARMSALAGMIDRVDQELGRLIQDLEANGELENTLILFLSDNGACPFDRRSNDPLGDPFQASTRWSDSTGWAWARNSPFRYYKQNQYEGGIGTPAIVHWPAGLKTKAGSITTQPAHLVDVLPTLAELCGARIPDTWPGREVQPVSGVSLAKVFAGEPLGERPPIHLLFSKDRGLRDGDWKAVSFRSEPWELYNIGKDRAETVDLASKEPKRLTRMVEQWTAMSQEILGAPKRSYKPVSTTAKEHLHAEWTNYELAPGIPARKEKASPEKADKEEDSGADQQAVPPYQPPFQMTSKVTRAEVIRETLAPYKGRSEAGVEVSTMTGKVLTGYQGWFTCPGDGSGLGWRHWGRRGKFEPGACTIDYWPDVSELDRDELFETSFRHEDGNPAFVYSPLVPKTVSRHFGWMREHGIEGAFVQRFIGNVRRTTGLYHLNVVLSNCRAAANEEGRAWAVMYDLSGIGKGDTRLVVEDWKMLVDHMKLGRDPGDRAYLHHRDRPVVAVWGIGFNDNRRYTLEECAQLIRFLKDDPVYGGNTVMLGVPTYWRTLVRDCLSDPQLHEIIRMADIVSPWMVGRFRTPEQVEDIAQRVWAPDLEWCEANDKEYLPVAFPGFSWHNLKPDAALDQTPRLGGRFLWKQFVELHGVGATMVYQAMFDEVDEGTAIFKCTNDPPVGDSPFLDYEGLPSDHYLWLVGQGGRLIRGEIESTAALPERH